MTEACHASRVELERSYERKLILKGVGHSDDLFMQFLADFDEDICPEHDVITYVDGKGLGIKC